ncbi:MAG: tetratricopeptide repeat protein [Paracoccaceae bacterium]|nr:tetratricopeptide repeat protein [Paracoccaceae bacterium]
MKIWITVIFFSNLINFQFSFAGDILKGFEEYNKGNYAGALVEWEDLAEKNDSIAQSSLAIMYQLGHGVRQDNVKAFELLSLSARQGFAPAQMSLGHMYENALGTSLDSKRAYMWYTISSSADKSAKTLLELLKARMSEDDIQDAKKLVNECLLSDFTNC